MVERYWQETAPEQLLRDEAGEALTVSPQALADSLALERRYLASMLTIARPADDGGLTYDLFRRGRELRIEGYLYPQELMPLDGFDGMPAQFAKMAAGSGRQRFVNAEDYGHWLERCAEFGVWTHQAIGNMRDGARRGYVLPAAVVQRVLPMLDELGRDDANNVFYRAAAALPKSIGDADHARLVPALDAAVKKTVLPAYRELHEFLRAEYLPKARNSVGLSALPLGDRWYAYLIRRDTGSVLKPNDIHALGLAEVDKLRVRLQAVLLEVGFVGTPSAYLETARGDVHLSYRTTEDLITAYQQLGARIGEAAPSLFSLQPKTEFDLRATTLPLALRDRALWYRPSMLSGGGRGVLYIDATGIADESAFFEWPAYLREAVPGRQYQLEVQNEREELPNFRRFGRNYAFEQGWMQYAASLGEELGVYREPQARVQWLAQQVRCAASLVVDTGLHSKNWTREQALEYWQAQVPLAEEAAVDRMIGEPARALACELGMLQLAAMRTHAQAVLGERFDVQAFHAALLQDGAMPFDLLDAKMKRWLKSVQ